MSKVRRVDFSPDEWIAGTRELTLEERGAYWDLCALMYSRGGPIPDDRKWLMSVFGVERMRIVHRIVDQLIERGKIKVLDADENSKGFRRLTNGRAAAEIARSRHRIGGLRNQPQATAEPQPSHDGATTEPRQDHDGATAATTVFNETKGLAATHEGNYQPSTINHQPSKKESIGTDPIERGALAEGSPPRNRTATGERLPEGWRPEDALRQWTIDSIRDASSGVSAGHELERFCDYWRAQPGAKGRKTDWPATWRNWIRRAIEQEGKGNGSQRNGHARRAGTEGDPIAAGIRESLARRHLLPRG